MTVSPLTYRTTVSVTASMPGEPAVHLRTEGAAGSFRSTAPACTRRWDLDWIPDREQNIVPTEMLDLCLACPVRAGCLRSAVTRGERGYWAGTTTTDRRHLQRDGVSVTVAAADRMRGAGLLTALHSDSTASMSWYRRGCRCLGCRGCNADLRAAERARHRDVQPGRERMKASA